MPARAAKGPVMLAVLVVVGVWELVVVMVGLGAGAVVAIRGHIFDFEFLGCGEWLSKGG